MYLKLRASPLTHAPLRELHSRFCSTIMLLLLLHQSKCNMLFDCSPLGGYCPYLNMTTYKLCNAGEYAPNTGKASYTGWRAHQGKEEH